MYMDFGLEKVNIVNITSFQNTHFPATLWKNLKYIVIYNIILTLSLKLTISVKFSKIINSVDILFQKIII